jgi:hypothetical protein
MTIVGRGKVVIGNNFHSGPECLMIAQIYNYDHGNAVPYDNTYIPKDIIIEDIFESIRMQLSLEVSRLKKIHLKRYSL